MNLNDAMYWTSSIRNFPVYKILVHSLQLDIWDSGFDLGIPYSQYFQI